MKKNILSTESLFNKAVKQQQEGKFEKALKIYDSIINKDPCHLQAYINLAILYLNNNNLELAKKNIDVALNLNPFVAEAYNIRGEISKCSGYLEEAVSDFEKSISLKSNYFDAINNHAVTLSLLGKGEDSLKRFEYLCKVFHNSSIAHLNYGEALRKLKRPAEAMPLYDKSLSIEPNFKQAIFSRGLSNIELKKYEHACNDFLYLTSLDQNSYEAFFYLAETYNLLGFFDKAMHALDKCINLNDKYLPAIIKKAEILYQQKKIKSAADLYQEAIILDPQIDFLLGIYIYCKLELCCWHNLPETVDKVLKLIKSGNAVCYPPTLLLLSDDPQLQLQCSLIYANQVKKHSSITDIIFSPSKRRKDHRIRLAYYSSDFHTHPVMQLVTEVFEKHNQSYFELFAISFDKEKSDNWRKRIKNCFSSFIDVHDKNSNEVLELSKNLNIDIAVDLNGYTNNCRPDIFLNRAAPIQINFLGYPSTLGFPNIDYIVADKIIIPEEFRKFYSEKILYMPSSYQPNCKYLEIQRKTITRCSAGLPEKGLIFCNFNQQVKINQTIFDIWCKILKRSEGSVLWLLVDNKDAQLNLRRELANKNIDEKRLIFAEKLPNDAHLNRLGLADIFLDTIPYNAHTTASDALRMGLPIITCAGQSFSSRVAASLLHTLGLQELITYNLNDYENLAVRLASMPGEIASIRKKLKNNLINSVLFDSELYTKFLEQGYLKMYNQYRSGNSPMDIYL